MQNRLFAFFNLAMFVASLSWSINALAEHAGTVDLIDGSASRTDMSGIKSPLHTNDPVEEGDTLETAANSELHVKMSDAGFISLRPSSVIKIDQFKANGDDSDLSVMSIIRGAMRSVTGFIGKAKPTSVKFTTPNATIGIRGTDQEIIYVPEEDAQGDETAGTHHVVYEGKTSFESDQGKLEVNAGQSAFIDNKTRQPQFHPRLPDFIQKRTLRNEYRIDNYNRNIRDHIERVLHDRQLIKPNEHFEHFLNRRHALNNMNAGINPAQMEQRTALQSDRKAQHEERMAERQAKQNEKRLDKEPGRRKRLHELE